MLEGFRSGFYRDTSYSNIKLVNFCKAVVKILSGGFSPSLVASVLWWPQVFQTPQDNVICAVLCSRWLRTLKFMSLRLWGPWCFWAFSKVCSLKSCARPWVRRSSSPADVMAASHLNPSGDVDWSVPRAGCRTFALLYMGSGVPEHYTQHCPSFLAVSSCACVCSSDRRVYVGGDLWRSSGPTFNLIFVEEGKSLV